MSTALVAELRAIARSMERIAGDKTLHLDRLGERTLCPDCHGAGCSGCIWRGTVLVEGRGHEESGGEES